MAYFTNQLQQAYLLLTYIRNNMTKKVDRSDEAYNGKYLNFRNKLHQLVPGVDRKSCEGCALYDIPNCPDSITKLCRQGFILKKVNV